MSKIVKSVSFNSENNEDRELLEALEGVVFSRYVKELILTDIEKKKQPLKIVQKNINGGIKIVVGQ